MIKRDIVQKNEGKLSVLQMIGFCLMLLGVIAIMISSFIKPGDIVPAVVSVSFFITMLGFSFAFPSLLEGNEGLSTMRIIVFMVTNVICMLLLKLGWASGITSLTQIGLDQWWMGVIAFVFGAKATQSFFESKMALPVKTPPAPSGEASGETISKEEIIKLAIKQYSIKQKPGVIGVGRGFTDSPVNKDPFLQINVNDKKFIAEYSKPLEVELGNNKTQSIAPKVFFSGTPEVHSGRGGEGIKNTGGSNGTGTIGCIVLDNDTLVKHILSCQHVLNHDANYNRVSSPTAISLVDKPTINVAQHVSGMRTHEIDAGLAEIITQSDLFDNSNLGIIKGTRDLTTADINEKVKVKLTGYDIEESKVKKKIGVIVNNEFFAQIKYADGDFGIEDLIVLSEKKGNQYLPLSKPGYSGALVIDEGNFAIGLLVGGDGNYSYAIPINKILSALNCKILKL